MTEAEWLECTGPTRMLEFIRDKTTDRKLRLFPVACCRRLWHLMTDERCRHAVEVSERLADGLASNPERRAAALAGSDQTRGAYPTCWGAAGCAVGVPAFHAAERGSGNAASLATDGIPYFLHGDTVNPAWREAVNAEHLAQIVLLRDIFGNPFRPVAFPPSWRTDTAIALAQQMYGSRDFSAMPILADAIQDAGCDSEDILNHCRDTNQPHVRGCWVVDLVLGKE